MRIATTAHDHSRITLSTDRGPWRMDPPPPNDLQDLLVGVWPGVLVALLLLGLLLAFGSVVRDGVRRGEQLRSQMAVAGERCDGGASPGQPTGCVDLANPQARQQRGSPLAAQPQTTATLLPKPQQ